MTIKITNETLIKVIFFDDESASNQRKIFDGNVSAWRKNVGEDWNGFELGDRFTLDDNDKVRVFTLSREVDEFGVCNSLLYFIGPFDLNKNNISFDNLVKG